MRTQNRSSFSRRGFALPVALSVILVLATLAIALIIQCMSTTGLQKASEEKELQGNVAELVNGLFLDIFKSGDDSTDWPAVGMNGPPRMYGAGGPVYPFGGKVEGYTFSGSFNGGQGPWSIYSNPLESGEGVDPENDGFFNSKEGRFYQSNYGYDPRNFPIAPQHSLIFIKVQKEKGPARHFFTELTSLFPYAAVAENGDIELKYLTSTWDHVSFYSSSNERAPKAGMKPYIYGNKISIAEKLEGVAQTPLARAQAPITLGSPGTGSIETGYRLQGFTQERITSFRASLLKVTNRIEAATKDPGFDQFSAALQAAKKIIDGVQLLNTGNFSFIPGSSINQVPQAQSHRQLASRGSRARHYHRNGSDSASDPGGLNWDGSFLVKSRDELKVPFSITINGTLILEQDSLFHVAGDLTVTDNLIISKGCSVMTDGNLTVGGRTEIALDARFVPGINASIISNGSLSLQHGVRHLRKMPSYSAKSFPISMGTNPNSQYITTPPRICPQCGRTTCRYSIAGGTVSNPLWAAWNVASINALNSINAKAGTLKDHLIEGSIPISPQDEDVDVPGLLIAAEETITVTDSSGEAANVRDENGTGQFDPVLCGLVVSGGDVVVNFQPRGDVKGVVLSKGNIKAPGVTLSYYPYYCHGTIPTGTGKSTFVQLSQPHIIVSGEYRK